MQEELRARGPHGDTEEGKLVRGIKAGNWRRVPGGAVKLLIRNSSGRKRTGKNVPGREDKCEQRHKRGTRNCSENEQHGLLGCHRFQRYNHTPAFADLSVLLLNSPCLLNEQATLAGCWGRY